MATRTDHGGGRPGTPPRRVDQSIKTRRRAATRNRPSVTSSRPPALGLAIEEQRTSLATALSLLYCLHSALRRGIDNVGRMKSPGVQAAAQNANVTDITALLLVQLDSIHAQLDSHELMKAHACQP